MWFQALLSGASPGSIIQKPVAARPCPFDSDYPDHFSRKSFVLFIYEIQWAFAFSDEPPTIRPIDSVGVRNNIALNALKDNGIFAELAWHFTCVFPSKGEEISNKYFFKILLRTSEAGIVLFRLSGGTPKHDMTNWDFSDRKTTWIAL